MAEQQQEEIDAVGADIVMNVLTRIKSGKGTYTQILREAQQAVADAEKGLALIERMADLCRATKRRKRRRDAGQKRGPKAPTTANESVSQPEPEPKSGDDE